MTAYGSFRQSVALSTQHCRELSRTALRQELDVDIAFYPSEGLAEMPMQRLAQIWNQRYQASTSKLYTGGV